MRLQSEARQLVHCDDTAGHYLKLLMDAVFGWKQFKNEVVWHYQTSSGKPRSHFIRNTDKLLFYTREHEATFNIVREPWPETTLRKWQKDAKGIYRTNNGKRFYINPNGKRVDNLWSITLSSRSRERTGYPTQKPLALLERIIQASSNEGDMVFDPFCGCATTLVMADRLNRGWAGIDLSPLAIKLVNDRVADDRGHLWGGANALDTPPVRTDTETLPNYRTHRHRLYGEQEGNCAGCETHFPFRVMDVDHMLPQSRGGTDHPDNLQLLCSGCNRSKGNRTMAEWRASA